MCSVEKQFDLVDIENLAFSNLYVDPNGPSKLNHSQKKSKEKLIQPNSKPKVSRYPRNTLPAELKNRFEIDVKSQKNELYDDEFWRKDSYQKSAVN